MTQSPPPPETFDTFTSEFPRLAAAWKLVSEAGQGGPLDARTQRLVKLGLAIGAQREGAVHASVRKAQALGIGRDELDHVIRLAVGTVGFPATVAAYSWIRDLDGEDG